MGRTIDVASAFALSVARLGAGLKVGPWESGRNNSLNSTSSRHVPSVER